MIYVDTSVILAELLGEDRRPSDELWNETLVSSRLLEYELWSRVYGRGLASSHSEAARALVGRLALVEMVSPILVRALEPFPAAVRTLDALHLASAEFLRERQPALRLATYGVRQAAAAEALGIGLYDLDSGTRDATRVVRSGVVRGGEAPRFLPERPASRYASADATERGKVE